MKVWLILVAISWIVCVALGAGTLYGIAPEIARLVKINPTNGMVSPIGRHSYPTELTSQQVSSLDAKAKIYYMIAYNSTDRNVYLVGLSLKDGTLITNIKLPFADNGFIGVGQYCDVIPDTGEVLVVGRDKIRQRHNILKINPKTKSNVHIASIGDIDVLGGAAAYDPDQEIYWVQFGLQYGGINLFGYNVKTKALVHNLTDPLNLETMNFDEKTGSIRGIGLQVFSSTNYTRVMLSLESKSGKITVLGKIPGYFIIQASLGAINENNRAYYAYLQPTSPKAPFDLVTVNLDNGKVENSVAVQANTLPWSIAYDPTL